MSQGPVTPEEVVRSFDEVLGTARVRRCVKLGPVTTFKAGGDAEWFLEAGRPEEIVAAMQVARRVGLPATLLGGGSNVLVGEKGVAGLVIRARRGSVTHLGSGVVRAEAGVSLNELVRWTARRGLAGLERWAGTPGTVGGAIHGNAHFQGHLIGDQVLAVGLVDRSGVTQAVSTDEMEFRYDESRLGRTGEAVLWVDFAVTPADSHHLWSVARASVRYRKQTQPLSCRSAGCIFRNPDPRTDQVPTGVPASAGALIDRAGLKGVSIGGASISPVHANFIVSDGTATPGDIRTLIVMWRRERSWWKGDIRCEEASMSGATRTRRFPCWRHAC